MPDLGHRRSRRLTMTALVGLLLARPAAAGGRRCGPRRRPGRHRPRRHRGHLRRGADVRHGRRRAGHGRRQVEPRLRVRRRLDRDRRRDPQPPDAADHGRAGHGHLPRFGRPDDWAPSPSTCTSSRPTGAAWPRSWSIEPGLAPVGTVTYLIDASAGSATSTVVGGALDIVEGPSRGRGRVPLLRGHDHQPQHVRRDRRDRDAHGLRRRRQRHRGLRPGRSRRPRSGRERRLQHRRRYRHRWRARPATRVLADAQRSDDGSVYITSWANYFDDLPDVTFRRDIVWLAEQRITTGCAPGRYCPSSNVTRAQMALFLDRALGLAPTATDFFTDDNGATGEAAINRLAASGITGGCAPSKFCPTAGRQARPDGLVPGPGPGAAADVRTELLHRRQREHP